MLILKGYGGKSTVTGIIMNATNSICFVYNEYPILFNSICVDSKEYSLENFLECISEELKEAIDSDKHYDYLLIYTNQNEEDLQGIMDWVENDRRKIPCRDIILTCK